jgi:uncharacterized Fe-S cluster-containing protein
MKILSKLQNKLKKSGLAEKEKNLMTFLDGSETSSLMKLQIDSTTRKYGELAVLEGSILR